MIQRIQSLYLFVSIVLVGLIFFFPLYTAELEGMVLEVDMLNAYLLSGDQIIAQSEHLYVPVLAGLVALVSAISIFLFKNRQAQMKMARLAVLLNTGLMVAMFFAIEEAKELVGSEVMGTYGVSPFLPIAGMVACFLASRAIMKDEMLVRSANRLR